MQSTLRAANIKHLYTLCDQLFVSQRINSLKKSSNQTQGKD